MTMEFWEARNGTFVSTPFRPYIDIQGIFILSNV